jgi:hypothetical protein
MSGFRLFPLFAATVALGFPFAMAGGKPAQHVPGPPTPPPVPAELNVITFSIRSEGEMRKIVVTPAPGEVRIDSPDEGYSIIYERAAQFYIGLENRNYTYWEFSWPDVKAAVEGTARYATRLKDLGVQGLNGYLPDSDASTPNTNTFNAQNPFAASDALLNTNSPPPTPPPDTMSDTVSGYVWKPTDDRERIAGFDCVRWRGESVSADPVDAWCYAGTLPRVQDALARLREINEPIALVPVRTLVPPFVFAAEDDLTKGGVIPLRIVWGEDADKNRFELESLKVRTGNAKLFSIPPLYVKTTLVTMDGIGNQSAAGVITNSTTPEPPERMKLPDR